MNTMKTMIAVAVFALAIEGLTGCADVADFNTQMPNYAQIEVITEPAGARITVGGNYVGDSPCTLTLNHPGWGTEIVAIPNEAGEYQQSFMLGTNVPSRIFFGMYMHPV